MNLVFNMALPFLTMLVMNYMIYRAMNRPQRGRRGEPYLQRQGQAIR